MEYAGTCGRAARTAPAGAGKVRDLASIDGAAIATDKEEAESSGPRSLRRAWPPASRAASRRSGSTARSRPSSPTACRRSARPQAWAAGYNGTGVDVAVLDTGVDADAPRPGRPHRGGAAASSPARTTDRPQRARHARRLHDRRHRRRVRRHGEGRRAGRRPARRQGARRRRLRPGLLDHRGHGVGGRDQRAEVVSMSLGDPNPSDGTDPIVTGGEPAHRGDRRAVRRRRRQQLGPEFSLGSPGAADAALTVGAVDGHDQLAVFSSRARAWATTRSSPRSPRPASTCSPRAHRRAGGEGSYQR